MTRNAPRPLWRVVLVDEQDDRRVTYLTHADDADEAAELAEIDTGHVAVIVDDVTPRRRHSNRRPAGLLTVQP